MVIFLEQIWLCFELKTCNWGGGKNKPTCWIFRPSTTPDSFGFVTVMCSELLGLFLYTYLMNKLA